MTFTHSMIIQLTSPAISSIMVSMNRLTTERRAQILGMMVEGNSIRAIVRMTGRARTRSSSYWRTRARHSRPIKIASSAICRASASSSTRFGLTPTANSARFLSPGTPRKTLAISGLGLHSTPIPSWYRPGASAIGAERQRSSLSVTYPSGSRIAFRLPATVTGLT